MRSNTTNGNGSPIFLGSNNIMVDAANDSTLINNAGCFNIFCIGSGNNIIMPLEKMDALIRHIEALSSQICNLQKRLIEVEAIKCEHTKRITHKRNGRKE